MLDNLMDHISAQAEKKRAAKVSFAIPEDRNSVPVSRSSGPSVVEYELESESDSESDSDFESDDSVSELDGIHISTFSESDDDDYYYSSEEEDDIEIVQSSAALASFKSYKLLPVMNLSASYDLSVIYEEDLEEELPELSRSTSDSESEDEVDVPNYVLAQENAYKISSEDLLKRHGHKDTPVEDSHRHQRHNAIYLMEHIF